MWHIQTCNITYIMHVMKCVHDALMAATNNALCLKCISTSVSSIPLRLRGSL